MSWLLDTNVVSEWERPAPDPGLVAWTDSVDPLDLYLSVATLAELRFGAEIRPAGRRKDDLKAWIEATLATWFDGRVLDIDAETAETWARLAAQARRTGLQAGVMDIFIGATALRYDLTLVTRNVKHFTPLGISVLNPWSG